MEATPKSGNYVCMFLYAFTISLACLFTFQAKGLSQPGENITLKANNIALFEVFKSIYKQTKLKVSYSNSVVNDKEKVSVDFSNTPIQDVMAILLKDKDLKFTVTENLIIIGHKDKGSSNGADADTVVNVIPSVSGKVTDAEGKPIPGATVMVKGRQHGATTDADGNFSLTGIKKNSSLIIRSIGYEMREVPVKGKTVLITLPLVIQGLDETIIIGYGTTTRRLSTGNINTIKAKEIETQPVSNPLLALQGRVPGLFIEQSNGLAGTGVTVRIQGQNSMTSGNDPLFVVDGVPYPSQLIRSIWPHILGSSGNTFSVGSSLSFINPADIESIDILKDADATAIYGSRAANGAILITTKSGKAGPVRANINIQKGWGKVTRKLKLLNTPQYLQMRREAIMNDEIAIGPTDYDINGAWDTTRHTDWQKELIGGTAQYDDVQLSISGGRAGISYLLGGSYHKETTVSPGDISDTRGAVHFNINNLSSNDKLRIQLTGNYMIDDNRIPPNHLTDDAILLPPNAPPLYNPDGSLNWKPDASGVSTWTNPLAEVLYTKFNVKTSNLIANAVISYNILPGLEVKSSFGFNNLSTNETLLIPSIARAPQDRPVAPRTAVFGNGNISTWITEPQMNYNRVIGKGNLNILLGGTLQQTNTDQISVKGVGYNSDLVLENLTAASTITNWQPTVATVYKYNSIYGRIGYNLKNKYLVNLTARRDGSSRFGEANRFHVFGSVGAAWIFSEEDFLKRQIPFVSFGKIRGSYGTTGNDQIGDYRTLNEYSPVRADAPYQGATGLQINDLPNPHLEWEETRKLQFGLELGVFKDRLLLNANYFRNRSSNQLLPFALPFITGFNGIVKNFPALVENRGWELSLNTTNLTARNFRWNTTINFTLPYNKLVSYPDLESSPYANTLIKGESINIFKKFHFIGVDPETGRYLFADKDGKPTFDPISGVDDVLFTDNLPKFYGGIQNNFQFKGFEIDVLFQFAKQKGAGYFFGNLPGSFSTNQPVTVLNRWKQPGDEASIQKYNSTASLFMGWANAQFYSDAGVTDASYIRLKNLSLSWQLPLAWKRKLRMQQARIYAHGQNLFTFTNYIGMDPENRSTWALPPLRVFTFGMQVTL
jgi:TonB-linked SusC/RagA family outer membrane protein